MMGDLTKNISRHELQCNCGKCDFQTMDFETINIVQEACEHFAGKLGVAKVVLRINSAHRCFEYNRSSKVGSNNNSQHPRGNALDHKIDGVSVEDLCDYYCEKYPGRYGIGLYNSFVHFDTRAGRARWGGAK